MRRAVPLLLLVGCDRLKAVDALTDPVVAQAMFMGVDIPAAYEDEVADAEDFPYAAVCNVFLASVNDPSKLADAPVTGARIRLRSDRNGTLEFREVRDEESGEFTGKYTLDSSDGLVYEPGDAPTITFEYEGDEARLEVAAPDAPDYDMPGAVGREESVRVDLSGYRYTNAVGASYDLDRSKLWWDNLPESVDEVYEFTHAEDAVEALEFPGDAFPRVGTYVVGVGGMAVGDTTTFEGVNATLSAFVAGRLSLRLVSVED